jgi:hypothetical protein
LRLQFSSPLHSSFCIVRGVKLGFISFEQTI